VWRTLLLAVSVVLFGWFIFYRASQGGVLVAVKPELRQAYPFFNPLIYSLDVFLPVVDLHQKSYWMPVGPYSYWTQWYLWVHTLAGWILTTLAVGGLTGLIKRD
jgi:hypothetical protein